MKSAAMETGGGHPGVKRQLSGSSSRGQNSSSRSGSSSQYSPALFDAVRGGKVDAALSIIAGGADPNSVDPGDGRSVLQVAVEGGTDIWLVKELLRLGASANKPHPVTGQTCLHVAARRGYQVCVRALLGAKAEVDARDHSGQTALMAALQAGHSLVAQELLEAGCDVNAANAHGETALHAAARGGHVTTAEELINYGADTTLADDRNQTAFYLACKGEHVELASLLARHGSCDVNVQESQTGRTPLHWAVELGNGELVRMLIQRGADLNVADKDWYTPFLLALDRGQKDFVTYMLATNRCDVSVINRFSYTALHMAARDGHVDLIDQFVAQRQDVNVKGPNGSTPLMVAAFEGRVDVVSRLCEHGAMVTFTDRFRATALIHAILSPESDETANRIVSRLIRANVDVNLGANVCGLMGTIDTTRWRITAHLESRIYTPLDVALMAQRYTIIAMLVKRGCLVPKTFRKLLEHRQVTAHLQAETRDSVNTICYILRDVKSVRSLKELSRIAVFDSVRGQEPASVLKTKNFDKKVLQYLRFLDLESIAWNMPPTASQLHLEQKLSPVESTRSSHNVVTNGYRNNLHQHQQPPVSALASPAPVSTTSNSSSSSSPFVRNVSARQTYHVGQKSPNGIPRLTNFGFSPNNNSGGTKSPTTKQQNGLSLFSPPKTTTSSAANQNLAVARPTNNVANGNKTSPVSLSNNVRSNGVNQYQEIPGYKPGKTNAGISSRATAPSSSANGKASRSRNDSESSQVKGYKTFDTDTRVYAVSNHNSPLSSVTGGNNNMTDRNNNRNSKTTHTSKSPNNSNSNSHSNGKSNGVLHVTSNGAKPAYVPLNSNPIGGNLHVTIDGLNGSNSATPDMNMWSPASINGGGKWSPASPLSPLSPLSPVSPADRPGTPRSRLPQPMRKQQLSPSSVMISNSGGGLASPAEEIDYFGEEYY